MSDTILITGANRGIGLELVKIFSDHNWQVLACCRHPEQAEELKKLEGSNRAISTFALDVTDNEAINRLAKGLHKQPIDILLNNAGIYGPENQAFGNIGVDVWLEVMRTNVTAPLKMAEAFVDSVAASRLKIIGMMGSMMGSLEDNTSGDHYIYRTSKAAVHMVTKSISIDLRDRGIISVVVHPGWVQTEMGGPQAPTSAAESAAGLYHVLTGLTAENNGQFLTFEGKELPW